MLIFELHQVFVGNFATMKKFLSKTYLYILKRKKPIVSRFWKFLRFYYEILKISNPMIQLMVQIFLHICYIRSKFWFSLPLSVLEHLLVVLSHFLLHCCLSLRSFTTQLLNWIIGIISNNSTVYYYQLTQIRRYISGHKC